MNAHTSGTGHGPDENGRALQDALRLALSADDSQALQARVLAQWQGSRPTDAPSGIHRQGAGASLRLRRASGWLGAAGLVLCIALAWGWWQHRLAEAALDELGDVDVLSQISAGEM